MDIKGGFPPAPACSSCVAQAAPSPPCARPTHGVLFVEVFVLSLLQGLLVEFHFFQYRLVFRCMPCLLCWGEASNTPRPP